MDHRFQVFVSSTYSDLVEERSKVAQSIIDADCFPAGMETFPASGDEQFEYIRKVIDQSDYYVLLIGGRYGSRLSDGMSYTEREFDYAVSVGLPILVFPHKDPTCLPPERREHDVEGLRLLDQFRSRALNGRLAKFWVDADVLANQVMRSLLKIVKENPGTGWLRASAGQFESMRDQLTQANSQATQLKQEVARLHAIISKPADDLSSGDDQVVLTYVYRLQMHRGSMIDTNDTAIVTWNQLLRTVGPDLLDWRNEDTISYDIAQVLASIKSKNGGHRLTADSIQTVRIQFLALGLIERQKLPTVSKTLGDFWRLTEAGQHQLFKLRPIRKPK